MNILIKLTCLIGLVIAPILGNGHQEKKVVIMEMKTMECSEMIGKCDMTKCATMTKDECAKMCDSLGCSASEKEMCLSHYGADGKFIATDAKMCGKCDMSECAKMTKDQCAKMCDEKGCSAEEKEMCLSQYDENGKFVAKKAMECCKMDAPKGAKEVRVEITNNNGKSKATIITTVDGKPTTQTFEGTEAEVKAKVDAVK